MGFCGGGERLHSTLNTTKKGEFIAKEQDGRQWMKNFLKETSGVRKESGYIELRGFLL